MAYRIKQVIEFAMDMRKIFSDFTSILGPPQSSATPWVPKERQTKKEAGASVALTATERRNTQTEKNNILLRDPKPPAPATDNSLASANPPPTSWSAKQQAPPPSQSMTAISLDETTTVVETALHGPEIAKEKPPNPPSNSRKIISDLVRDSKLETVIGNNGDLMRHISYESNPGMRQRRMRKEETRKRLRELGNGAFGCVWLEKRLDGDDDARKLRAVKEIAKMQPQERDREIDCNRELEAIAKFSHSKYVHCFVQSFGWYESDRTIFIAMEYLEKGDLQSYLTKPFPEDEVKHIIFQLLEGLIFMHENGFAHRDLKPANILVSESSPNWWVKIGDFGISKRARAEEEATAFRTVVGTRGYIAPEVIGIYSPDDMNSSGANSILSDSYTVAVDLWALGAIAFRLLSSKNAFDDPRQLAMYVIEKRPFPWDAVSKWHVSDACMKFLEHVMARSPKGRPSSSQALDHTWFQELQESMALPELSFESLSISQGKPGQGNTTIGTNETIASANWPSNM